MKKIQSDFLRRAAALLTAWMMLMAVPAFVPARGFGEQALPEDWDALLITLRWADADGEGAFVEATPVAESAGAFWAMVPEEAFESGIFFEAVHPEREYIFEPASGTMLTEATDAGDRMDGISCTQLLATDANQQTVVFLLYLSTVTDYPEVEELPGEEPEEMPEEIPEEEPEEIPEEEPEEIPEEEPEEIPEEEPEEIPEEEPEEIPEDDSEDEMEGIPAEVPAEQPAQEPIPVITAEPEPTEYITAEPEIMAEPAPTEYVTAEPEITAEPAPTEYITAVPEPTAAPEQGLLMPEEEPEEAAAEEPEEEAEEESAEEPEEEPAEEEEPTEAPTPTVAPTEVPAETEIPVGEMINRVGRTNKSVRFREQKSTKSGIIKTFQSNEYVYMIREELDAEGTRWTLAQDHGQFGYVMSEFLDQLPQWESDRIMSEAFATPVPYVSQELADSIGATPTPVPEPVVTAEPENEALTMAAVPEEEAAEEAPAEEDEAAAEETEAPAETETPTPEPTETPTPEPTETPEPTPAETEIPAGEMINRFGTTNAKDVRFRAEPSTGAKKLRELAKGSYVYMLREETNSKNEHWTRCMVDGQTGYIMSKFLKVLSQAESDQVMEQECETPVPFVTAEELDQTAAPATEVPTETPTLEPTATPTMEPTATPTEEPTATPTAEPTATPTAEPTATPTAEPTATPTAEPTATPTAEPTATPTTAPTATPTAAPTEEPENEAIISDMEPEDPAATEQPSAVPATTTQAPPQVIGYAVTIGDGIYLRNWPSSSSVILDELKANKVVFVNGQVYEKDTAWHQVEYDQMKGYIRADMLRMMGQQEVMDYLNNVNATQAPTAQVTVQPYDSNSLSSYGYVSASSVNFRKSPSTSAERIRQLKRYALCLVLGTEKVGDTTWYKATYDGKTGYISGEYFKQLTLSELERFLDSEDYLTGIQNNSSASSGSGSSATAAPTVVSAEDAQVATWTNPQSGSTVSYEPFDPFATAEPVATQAPTEYLDSLVKDIQAGTLTLEAAETRLRVYYQDAADRETKVEEGLAYLREKLGVTETTEAPTEQPTETPLATVTVEPENTEQVQTGSGALGWVIAAAVLIGGGLGVYYWLSAKRKKEAQEAAKRAAQARKKQQAQGPNGANRPPMNRQPGSGSPASEKAVSPQQAAKARTGNYTEQNGRPRVTPTGSGTAQSGNADRPYGKTIANPYARYTTKPEENRSFSASYRPADSDAASEAEPMTERPAEKPAGAEGSTGTRRRSRSSRYTEDGNGTDAES